MAGFWTRQFQLPATPAQRWFDASFGIAVPVLCLYLDPTVFRSFGAGGAGLLARFRLFGYVEIALSIVTLAYYLFTRRASSVLSGFLLGSAVFSLLLGAVMLPLTAIGLLIIIGILGFAPFVTGFVFLRNAWRCWQQYLAGTRTTSRSPARFRVALSLILILSVPAALQGFVSQLVNRALVRLQSGPDQDFASALHTLQWIPYDADELAFAYQKTSDAKQRERLARAFTELTGQTVEERLAQLND